MQHVAKIFYKEVLRLKFAVALQNLFNEIYLRDIAKRNRVKNIGELEDLLNILYSAIGSLTNTEKLKNTFKTVKKSRITSATIKKYLDYLWMAILILKFK